MKRWKRFVGGAGMFALMGVIAKLIGVFYRLPLTNILGAEGMGLYQMIFPLYSLLLAVSSGGLPSAISKYVSELNALHQPKTAVMALRWGIIILAALGGAATLFIFFSGGLVAAAQGNVKAGSAYAAISPAIILSGLIACIRGYFQGHMNMLPSGVSQVIEQLVKVGAGLFLAWSLVDRGIEYGVFGALLGITISEAAALFYLIVRYFLFRRKQVCVQAEFAEDVVMPKPTDILRELYKVALPITLGSLVMPLSQALDSFLVINLLVKSGAETANATSLFGLFNGPVGSLINMPTVITVALGAALLPKVAFALKSGDDVSELIDRTVRTFIALILPCAVVFALVPYPVLKALYHSGLSEDELIVASRLLRLESVNLMFLGFIHVTSAMMQADGRAKMPVFNLLIGAALKAVVTVTLIPSLGIYGAAVSNIVCYGVTCALDLFAAKKRFKFGASKGWGKIAFCTACFGAVLMLYNVLMLVMSDIAALFCAGGVAVAVYLLLIIKTKSILLSEMLS